MDSELPHLVALEDDLLSTGILLYHLKVCTNYVSTFCYVFDGGF